MKILNRWTDVVLWEGEAGTVGEAVIAALRSRADLTGADLTGADLTGADLTGENLTGANLTGANLTDANLTDANLTRADLTDANLTRADLTRADLTGANLTDANLTDADLTRANLTPIRDDIWAVLSAAPMEADALLLALREGRVDGSQYEGECACLIGTIANARDCNYKDIPVLKPNASRPSERFFLGINQGDTPATNQYSAFAEQCVSEWLTAMRAAFGAK